VTRLRAGRPGFDCRQGQGIFLFAATSRPALRLTQIPVNWVTRALSPDVKWSGSEADHSPPSRTEVKNAWSYTSTLPYDFRAWCLVKHRDTFTFKGIREWKYSSTHSLTSALDGGEWSVSRPGRFTPTERAPGTHRIGGGPQSHSGRGDEEKNSQSPPGIEP
jgi:hypothetical protein